ncbi:hypothetical protein P4S72_27240 [Vibrio sp. PP-XX7]
MRSSIQKYLFVLHDHDLSAQGVGARHRKMSASVGGGGYPENCSKLELSLSASETEAAFQCIELADHWRDILNHIGALTFLELWRRLEALRTERRLRIAIPKYAPAFDVMSSAEFEEWLDAQHLTAAFFEVYFTVTADQFRYIWRRLYQAAQSPGRRALRIYVPLYLIFNAHLRKALGFSLLRAGMNKTVIPHHLLRWTGQSLSLRQLTMMAQHLGHIRPSKSQPFQCNGR